MEVTEQKECPLFTQESLDSITAAWGNPFRMEISYKDRMDSWGIDFWELNFTHHAKMRDVCEMLPDFLETAAKRDPGATWYISEITQCECALYSILTVLAREERSK